MELGRSGGAASGLGLGRSARVGEELADEFFCLSDREFLLPYLACQLGHLRFVLQAEKRAGVTLGDLSVAQERLNTLWKVYEPQGVGDRGPALAEPTRELIFG